MIFHWIRQGFPTFLFRVHVILLSETCILIVLRFFTWRHEISLQKNCKSKASLCTICKLGFFCQCQPSGEGLIVLSGMLDLKPLTQICVIGPWLSERPEDNVFQDSPRQLTAINFMDFEHFIKFKPAEKMICYLFRECWVKLCSILCNNLNGKRNWKRIVACIHITKSLCWTPEANAALLINYTPI